jgi:hypothetical protein
MRLLARFASAACVVATLVGLLGLGASKADAQRRRTPPSEPAPANTNSRDNEARMLFEAGRVAYSAGRFDDALGYFRRAHEISGRAILLYNVGSAADKLRQDAIALDAFRRYLEAVPDAENREEVEARVRVLEGVLAASQTRASAAATTTSTTPNATTPTTAATATTATTTATTSAATTPAATTSAATTSAATTSAATTSAATTSAATTSAATTSAATTSAATTSAATTEGTSTPTPGATTGSGAAMRAGAATATNTVPTPAATAAAAQANDANLGGSGVPAEPVRDDESGGIFSRWWFWTIVGVAVAGATVGVVAATTGGDTLGPFQPGDDGSVYMTLVSP